MSTEKTAPSGSGDPPGDAAVHSVSADSAYGRAWWSLALYPVSAGAAFAVGEGIFSMLTESDGQAASWQVLLAATPALLIFMVPGILAVAHGRKAMRLGRREGAIPATVGAVIAIGFVGLNIASYVVGLVV